MRRSIQNFNFPRDWAMSTAGSPPQCTSLSGVWTVQGWTDRQPWVSTQYVLNRVLNFFYYLASVEYWPPQTVNTARWPQVSSMKSRDLLLLNSMKAQYQYQLCTRDNQKGVIHVHYQNGSITCKNGFTRSATLNCSLPNIILASVD